MPPPLPAPAAPQANISAGKFDANLFSEAQAEVFRLMDKDSFAARFLPVIRKRFGARCVRRCVWRRAMRAVDGRVCTEELKAAGLGAPFCVEVCKDGCRVGVLKGNLTMTSLTSLATQARGVWGCPSPCTRSPVRLPCRTRK